MTPSFEARCLHMRKEIMALVRGGRRGHIASAFSLVETLVVLFDHIMRYRAHEPKWPERDRLILSKGHGCLALYAALADKGYFSKEHYAGFCAPDGLLGGHPEERVPGVEAPTGSLGHGLSIGVGYAINARLDGADYRTYVILGDGECNEGSIWEAAMGAAKHKLDNLYVLVDYNKHMSFGTTYDVCDLEPFADKWRAFGFHVHEADMVQQPAQLRTMLETPPQPGKPTAVICHTIKGQGVSFMENDLSWHHKSKIKDEDIDRIIAHLEAEHA